MLSTVPGAAPEIITDVSSIELIDNISNRASLERWIHSYVIFFYPLLYSYAIH